MARKRERTLEVKPEIPLIKEPEKVEEPKSVVEPVIPLRVFITVAGPKWDQLAGFVSWATRQHLGPMTMVQWREELQKFVNRPVG